MSTFEGIALKIKRREGPVADFAYRLAKGVLGFHLPDSPLVRSLARVAYMGQVATREAGEKLRSLLWAEPLFRSRCSHVGENFSVERVPYILGHADISIGDNVTISGQLNIITGRFSDNPQLIIGNNVFIGHNTVISVNKRVEIRDHASVAGGCRIADSDGHPSEWAKRAEHAELTEDEMRPVVIGQHVWIGANAQILKGITIGDRSIIGAGSVVISDVPEDTLAMGSPARKVRIGT